MKNPSNKKLPQKLKKKTQKSNQQKKKPKTTKKPNQGLKYLSGFKSGASWNFMLLLIHCIDKAFMVWLTEIRVDTSTCQPAEN